MCVTRPPHRWMTSPLSHAPYFSGLVEDDTNCVPIQGLLPLEDADKKVWMPLGFLACALLAVRLNWSVILKHQTSQMLLFIWMHGASLSNTCQRDDLAWKLWSSYTEVNCLRTLPTAHQDDQFWPEPGHWTWLLSCWACPRDSHTQTSVLLFWGLWTDKCV